MEVVRGTARRLGLVARALRIGSRSFSLVDANPIPSDWHHITKIDPEAKKRLPLLYPLYLQHTSAVSVGGSRKVNSRNTEETFELLSFADIPVFHEPSAPRHVTDRTREMSDFLAIPEVLNGDVESLVGTLGEGVEHLRDSIVPELIKRKLPWFPNRYVAPLADFATGWLLERAIFEAYIIQNENSAAAREAGVGPGDLLKPRDAAHRALAAEKHLGSEVIYLEYSGTYGGEEASAILEAIKDTITWPRIWYGGGLYSGEDSRAVIEAGADAVVVGNVFHEIAEEERVIYDRAKRELPKESEVDEIRSWVRDEIDIADSAAGKYLSTILSVERPNELAETYTAQTVFLTLAIENVLKDLNGSNPQVISDSVSETVDRATIQGGIASSVKELLKAYVRTEAANHLERSINNRLPVAHLSVYD